MSKGQSNANGVNYYSLGAVSGFSIWLTFILYFAWVRSAIGHHTTSDLVKLAIITFIATCLMMTSIYAMIGQIIKKHQQQSSTEQKQRQP